MAYKVYIMLGLQGFRLTYTKFKDTALAVSNFHVLKKI